MVCRENKGRSALMGYAKHLQIQLGQDAFNDAEVQSLIHQVKHDGDALDTEAPLNRDEQVDMMRRLRAQIEADPSISESEKYRQSDRRPGMITRLDQEIERVSSGKTAKGDPLTPAQLNTASHMYAMQRLNNTLERVHPAKQEFLETNARHRGISYEEAQAEWSALMNQRGHFESRSKIRDDVRESLATAGVESHVQTNLGVSGRAINAMETMEQRRRESVSALESKPATTEEHSMARFVSPNSPKATLKCATCGQFGHEDSSCPNEKQTARLKAIAEDRALAAKGQELADDHRYATTATAQDIQDDYGVENVDDWRKKRLSEIARSQQELAAVNNGQGKIFVDGALRAKKLQGLEREQKRVEKTMDDNAVVISKDVADVRYNPDSGVLVVHRQADEDGVEPASIIRRCRPDEAADVSARLRTEPLDAVLATSLNSDRHRFGNRGDAEASLTMHRCPTCGQWASMSSGHKCPVSGGPSEELEHDRRRRRIEEQKARRARQKDGGENVALYEREAYFPGVSGQRMDVPYSLDGERGALTTNSYRFGKSSKVLEAVDDGKVATPAVQASFSDGTVTGKTTVWADDDGNRFISAHDTGLSDTGLRCDCTTYKNNGNCKHIQAARVMVQRAYSEPGIPTKAMPNGVVPGDRIEPGRQDQTAQDGLEINQERVGMNRLQALKNSRRKEEIDAFVSNRAAGQGATTLMVEAPKNMDGEAVDWPDTWTPQAVRDDGEARREQSLGKVTDLHKTSEVSDRFRTLMSNRFVEMPDGSKEKIKFAANKSSNPGGITINLPRSFQRTTASRRRAAQRGLANILGVPESSVTEKGLFIPNNTAHYAEFLDRASNNVTTRRINGPATVAVPTAEGYETSRQGSLRGWKGINPNV